MEGWKDGSRQNPGLARGLQRTRKEESRVELAPTEEKESRHFPDTPFPANILRLYCKSAYYRVESASI
jgi:hypothetical protein